VLDTDNTGSKNCNLNLFYMDVERMCIDLLKNSCNHSFLFSFPYVSGETCLKLRGKLRIV
jgi:hypothetical protein